MSAINKVHALSRMPQPGADPLFQEIFEGVHRENARKKRRVKAITTDVLRDILSRIDLTDSRTGTIAHRDYALLTIGFSGAFRRAELTSLTLNDVTFQHREGLQVYLHRSKTDQRGEGLTRAIPIGANAATCPTCAYVRWIRVHSTFVHSRHTVSDVLAEADTKLHICDNPQLELSPLDGLRPLIPVMHSNGWIRSKHAAGVVIAAVVQHRLAVANYNPADYAGHSLRAGFVTQAFRAGATTHEIMRQTGHKNPATLELYSRETDPMLHNAVTKLGL